MTFPKRTTPTKLKQRVTATWYCLMKFCSRFRELLGLDKFYHFSDVSEPRHPSQSYLRPNNLAWIVLKTIQKCPYLWSGSRWWTCRNINFRNFMLGHLKFLNISQRKLQICILFLKGWISRVYKKNCFQIRFDSDHRNSFGVFVETFVEASLRHS